MFFYYLLVGAIDNNYEVNQGSCPGEMNHSVHFPSSLPGEPDKEAKTA